MGKIKKCAKPPAEQIKIINSNKEKQKLEKADLRSCWGAVMCSIIKEEEKANKLEANTNATDENYDEGQNMLLSSEKYHCNHQRQCQPKTPQKRKPKKLSLLNSMQLRASNGTTTVTAKRSTTTTLLTTTSQVFRYVHNTDPDLCSIVPYRNWNLAFPPAPPTPTNGRAIMLASEKLARK